MNGNDEKVDEFSEGDLLIIKGGVLEKIEIDKDDDRKKLRISEDTFKSVIAIQKSLRQKLKGHKPDVNLVGEGLLIAGLKSQNAVDEVLDFCQKIFSGK